MNKLDAIKFFGLNNLTIEADIRQIEKSHDIDLGHRRKKAREIDRKYYPQFSEKLRDEANSMAVNYIIFYCLENSIRQLISERLREEYGENWWNSAVSENVRNNSEKNRKREISSGVTPRSSELIDYTNFG